MLVQSVPHEGVTLEHWGCGPVVMGGAVAFFAGAAAEAGPVKASVETKTPKSAPRPNRRTIFIETPSERRMPGRFRCRMIVGFIELHAA
jgi:hypothetical protein